MKQGRINITNSSKMKINTKVMFQTILGFELGTITKREVIEDADGEQEFYYIGSVRCKPDELIDLDASSYSLKTWLEFTKHYKELYQPTPVMPAVPVVKSELDEDIPF